MRILVVTPTYLPRWGGAELAIWRLAQHWGQRHAVQILTPVLPGADVPEDRGVSLTRYADRLYPPKWGDKLHWPWLKQLLPPVSLSTCWHGLAAVRRFAPDVVNLHYVLPNAALLAALSRRAIPMVLTMPSRLDVPGHGMPDRWVGLARRVAARADVTVVLTPDGQAAFWPEGCPAGKESLVIPYGARPERFQPSADGADLRDVLGIAADDLVILALQRLVPEKRVDRLLTAMALARPLTSRPMYLVIAGKGPDADRLRARAAELGIARQVHLVGFVPSEQLPTYLAMADVLAFSSDYETFGIVLVQAMAAGRPVIAMDSFAVRCVVDQGHTGWLVPPDDPQALAQRLVMCAADRKALRAMGLAARAEAEEHYDWQVIAEQYLEVFARASVRHGTALQGGGET